MAVRESERQAQTKYLRMMNGDQDAGKMENIVFLLYTSHSIFLSCALNCFVKARAGLFVIGRDLFIHPANRLCSLQIVWSDCSGLLCANRHTSLSGNFVPSGKILAIDPKQRYGVNIHEWNIHVCFLVS